MDILIVDDIEELLDILEEKLIDLGHNVIKATSGKIALELMISRNVDVIISDFNMPLMNGLELKRSIIENLNHCPPFILYSGELQLIPDNDYKNDIQYILKKPEDFSRIDSVLNTIEIKHVRQKD